MRKAIGIALLVVGVLVLVYGGFNYTKRTRGVQLGPVSFQYKEREHVKIPVWLGVVCVAAEAGFSRSAGRRAEQAQIEAALGPLAAERDSWLSAAHLSECGRSPPLFTRGRGGGQSGRKRPHSRARTRTAALSSSPAAMIFLALGKQLCRSRPAAS